MRFSVFAGSAIIPTLARIVLCAAFVPIGYHKVFHETEYGGDSGRILNELGIGTTITTAFNSNAPAVVLASMRPQDTPSDGDAKAASGSGKETPPPSAADPKLPEGASSVNKTVQEKKESVGSAAAEQAEKAKSEAEEQAEKVMSALKEQAEKAKSALEEEAKKAQAIIDEKAGAPIDETQRRPVATDEPPVPSADGARVRAQAMHGVTTLLVQGGWKKEWKPHLMAWVASLTELVGGALILVGLFSRVWGLGLAIAMGFAFYLTSLPALLDPGLFELALGIDHYEAFNRMFCQLGLGILALGVFLTGPGPLSLDRALFGRGSKEDLGEYEPVT